MDDNKLLQETEGDSLGFEKETEGDSLDFEETGGETLSTEKERSYIAFISYRHTPLDREAAERVQKKIENFIVPKEFREQVGGKKLGLCFRDEDELPASSSLTNSIYYALDHTKFLIVICTPNLPLSQWCEAEIKYFLKTHDRDHILAVLADGEPYESFSPYMLHTYDEEGNITGDTEPLAANIAGPNHTINNKAFKKEIVRLYAALIGCPFDELWQRERRARTNRLLSLAGAAIVVLAIFLGVVLNRNAKIEEQNTQIMEQNTQILAQNDQITKQYDQIQEQNTKIEEQNISLQTQLSTVLVDSGINKLKEHNLQGALQDGVNALESDDPSIYDHRAVGLLYNALAAGYNEKVQSNIVYEQAQAIGDLAVTDDERLAILKDISGNLSCIDLDQYSLKWQLMTGDSGSILYTKNLGDRFLYKSKNGLYCCSVQDGSLLWSYEHQNYCENYFQAISDDGTIFVVADHFGEDSYGPDNPLFLVFLNTADGSELGRSDMTCKTIELETSPILSDPHDYAGAFSNDNKTFACIIPGEEITDDYSGSSVDAIFSIDLTTFEKSGIASLNFQLNMLYGMDVTSGAKSIFFAGYSISFGGVYTVLGTKGAEEYSFEPVVSDHDLRNSSALGFDEQAFLANDCRFLSNGKVVLIMSDDDLFFFDRKENRLMRSYAMNGTILNAYWTDPSRKSFEIIMSNGDIIGYDLGTENMLDTIYSQEDFDQKDMVCAQPLNGGMIRNEESGKYLSVGGDGQNRVLLAQIVTDPNIRTFSFPEITDYSYLSGFDLLPGSDTAFCIYNGSQVFTFNRKTGEFGYSATYDDYFGLDTITLLDEEHFIVNDQVYGPDGTASSYGEPFGEKKGDTQYPSKHVRLADNSILSWNEYASNNLSALYKNDELGDLFGPYPEMLLLWKDGKPLEFSADPARALILREEFMSEDEAIFAAGASGMVLGYGRRISLQDNHIVVADESEFHFLDTSTETITTMKNHLPDSGTFTVVMGNKEHLAAILYADGNICIYSPDTGTVTELERHYTADEISAISFSKGDEYLAVITATGRLDLIDTASLEIVFSQTIDLLHEYYLDYGQAYNNVSAEFSADQSKLIIFSDKICILMDPVSWTIDSTMDGVLAYDDETDQFFLRGTDGGILSCPFYHKDDLKEWAESELEK